MTNEERRAALNLARKNALLHAEDAEITNLADAYEVSRSMGLASMWAHVAQAMKDGDPVHDGPDGRPISNHLTTIDGSLTR